MFWAIVAYLWVISIGILIMLLVALAIHEYIVNRTRVSKWLIALFLLMFIDFIMFAIRLQLS